MTENVIKEKKIQPSTIKAVKEAIEMIHGITYENEYAGGFVKFGKRVQRVATILVNRGCLIKRGHCRNTTYVWNPVAMKPTDVFIASVAEELVDRSREFQRRYREKVKAQPVVEDKEPMPDDGIPFVTCEEQEKPEKKTIVINEEIEAVVPEQPTIPIDIPDITDLSWYSDEELWEELKARGYSGSIEKHIVKRLD